MTDLTLAERQKAEKLTARQWLCAGGGGFEDGEDGIRACTMSAEHAIELMDEFSALYARSGERELAKQVMQIVKESPITCNQRLKAEFASLLSDEKKA